MLKIGRIPFLVCAPFFQKFDDKTHSYQFIDGNPKVHNQNLADALVDAAPSSSIEYAHHPEKYRVSSKICTSCSIEVRSVALFSNKKIEDLSNANVAISSQSETSVCLLKILLKNRFKIEVNYVDETAKDYQAVLYIGDQALEELYHNRYQNHYDLGKLWEEWQGMPFVFGAWMVREEIFSNPQSKLELDSFMDDLENNIDEFIGNLHSSVEEWCFKYPVNLPLSEIESYYQVIDYQMTPIRQKSLQKFFNLAYECGLIENKVNKIKYF